jgi:uncharacterized protein (DUF1800 family)
VKEAARALTGWTVDDGRFVEVAARHDDGSKQLFGTTGKYGGSDLVALLLRQPATSRRIAVKLCRQFFGENVATADTVEALAADLREHDLDVGRALGKILRSRLFFSEANIGNRVLGPTEFVVGAVRALGLFDPAPSTLALADWTARMGQELFDPPNVGGWPPGRAWIHTRAVIARSNFALALTSGRSVGLPTSFDAAALARKCNCGDSPDALLTFYHRLLFGTDPGADVRRRVNGAAGARVVEVLLASPEAQLG